MSAVRCARCVHVALGIAVHDANMFLPAGGKRAVRVGPSMVVKVLKLMTNQVCLTQDRGAAEVRKKNSQTVHTRVITCPQHKKSALRKL